MKLELTDDERKELTALFSDRLNTLRQYIKYGMTTTPQRDRNEQRLLKELANKLNLDVNEHGQLV